MTTRRLVAAAAVVVAAAAAACAPARGGADSGPEIVVLAASSLTDVVGELAASYESAHPGTTVTVGFGASSALAQQVLAGGPADVVVLAGALPVRLLRDAGAIEQAVPVATNALRIAVPRGNPGAVRGIADLADARRTVALCAPHVPCGAAARAALAVAGVVASVDTYEPDARAALGKVRLGEVDAALVYRTDVRAAPGEVDGVDLPSAVAAASTTTYHAAVLTAVRQRSDARRVVAFLASVPARRVLAAAGFGPP